jgi:hypothetical protein
MILGWASCLRVYPGLYSSAVGRLVPGLPGGGVP